MVVYSTRARRHRRRAVRQPLFARAVDGRLYILKGVEAAILAGIGSLLGSLVGGIILGVTEAIGSIYLPTAFRDAYGLVFLVAILLFQPAGPVREPAMKALAAWVPLLVSPARDPAAISC